jgi:hypothetical protein
MPWTVVKFLIPVPQPALLNHRPVELKLPRLTDPKASLSVTSQVSKLRLSTATQISFPAGLPGPEVDPSTQR